VGVSHAFDGWLNGSIDPPAIDGERADLWHRVLA
jgi:hypothetical protein